VVNKHSVEADSGLVTRNPGGIQRGGEREETFVAVWMSE
jgi:hypothetical protein